MANEIAGLDEVQAKLRQLGNTRKAKNAATRASRKAMAVVRKAAIQNAKTLDNKGSQNKIWKNITIKASKTKGDLVMMKVGVKGGARHYVKGMPSQTGDSGGDTFYWRFIEFGTATKPARPFLRSALNNNINQVQNDFADLYGAELDKEIAKL